LPCRTKITKMDFLLEGETLSPPTDPKIKLIMPTSSLNLLLRQLDCSPEVKGHMHIQQ